MRKVVGTRLHVLVMGCHGGKAGAYRLAVAVCVIITKMRSDRYETLQCNAF